MNDGCMKTYLTCRRSRLIFAVCLFALIWLGPADDLRAARVLRVGAYQNPPEVFYANAAHVEGISVDILEAIARAEGWTIQYVPGTLEEGLSRLQRGDLDLMLSVARTQPRAKVLEYHEEPVLHSWSEVYASEDANIHKITDLSSKRVAVVGGSRQLELLSVLVVEFHLTPTLVVTEDFSESIAAVADGRADAAITNPFNGRWLAEHAGLRDTAIAFAPMDIYFAASPQLDNRVLRALDLRLREMKGEPQSAYFEALGRWKRPQPFRLPSWLKWAGAAAALLLAAIAAWALSLRRYARKLAASELAQRHCSAALQEVNRALETFSSAVSHDLRTPLAAVTSLQTALLQQEGERLSENARRYVQRSLDAAGEMRELIQALLTLSRLGRQPLRREAIDLTELAQHVAADLQLTDARRHTPIDIQPGMVAQADNALARQVLANLMSNAWKFTAGAPAGQIEVGQVEDAGAWWFFVRDNGVGFDAAGADRLFEPFQRFHSSAEFAGTGIGLATVRRIVARHDGRIWADSSPGEGACFYFTLGPLTERHHA